MKKDNTITKFFMLFIPILIIETIMTVIFLPADEVLVPAEVIGDAAMLALVVGASLATR